MAASEGIGSTFIRLGANRYGKERIRLVRVARDPGRHELRDVTVGVSLEGSFEAAHVEGDQSLVIATDTMKNTVYALARDHLDGPPEAFGLVLARHFLGFEQCGRAAVTIREQPWARLSVGRSPSDHAFMRSGDYTRTVEVSATRDGAVVEAGVEDLVLLKTAKSGFAGFTRDRYTTLPDTDDRILATRVTASWRYPTPDVDFAAAFDGILAILLEVFAEHYSPAVQASIWLMGQAVLEAHPEVDQVRFSLPNLHHWLADLAPFGLENDGRVYVATTEPHGLIEATVVRR